MIIRLRSMCLLILLLFGDSAIRAEEIDQVLLDRFLDAVPAMTKNIERVSVKARLVTTAERLADSEAALEEVRSANYVANTPEIERIRTVTVRGLWGLETSMGRGTEKAIEYVAATNDQYAFRIRRSSPGTRCSIEFLQELGVETDIDRTLQNKHLEGRSFFVAPWTVFTVPLPQLVKSPFFEVKQVSKVTTDGRDLVRIDFEHLIDDQNRKDERLSDAYMISDPTKDWALKEYGATFFTGGIYQQTIEFGDPINGFQVPSKLISIYALPKVTPVVRRTVTTPEEMSADVTAEPFFLSHYGLPEPHFERSMFGAWMWYLVSGIACLIVAWIGRKRGWLSLERTS